MRARHLVLLLAAVAVPSMGRAAGLPQLELFGGWAQTRVRGDDPRFEPGLARLQGFQASLTLGARSRLGLVIDGSGLFGRLAGADLTRWSLVSGPRVSFHAGRVGVFVHALAGGVRTREALTAGDLTIADTTTQFGGAAGGGIALWLGDRLAVRLQGDVVVTRAAGGTTSSRRVAAGLTLRSGRRAR